jgi:S-adenosylmethionine:tRNA ribosyltransferase-isomerase
MNVRTQSIIQFDLPQHLSCPLPTEERNMQRDEVRLMITGSNEKIYHSIFKNVGSFLEKGDVLVVNTSATVASALPVLLPGGRNGKIHLSTELGDKEWLIEIREIKGNKTIRWKEGDEGMIFHLPQKASIVLKKRFYANKQLLDLWIAEFNTLQSAENYLKENASPIQYEKLDRQYPLSYYQTFFSFHPGSSEMPSAGRGFTAELIEKLLKQGVVLAPILLHTGVSSLEENELPYPEYMEIDPFTVSVINSAKRRQRRIIAVGTTAVRAIEAAANDEGLLKPYQGNTDLFIDENYKMKIADALLTGFHEPHASHLNMLQAIAGFDHIDNAYKQAIKNNYYWHQFGDLHLILP